MVTVQLELPETQVIDLMRQLSPASKRAVLQVLIPDLDELETLVDYGSTRIRALCAERGVDWNAYSEDEREHLIDKWLQC